MWANQGSGGGGGGGGYGSYGGDGQFSNGNGPPSGGGFVNSPGFSSPSASGAALKRPRANRTTPTTVADLLSATVDGSYFSVYGGAVELNQVSLIGLVRSVNDGPSRIDYKIDDFSGGVLEVKQFVDNEDTPEHLQIKPQRENSYVKIFGHIRRFGEKQTVVAFKVLPLENLNELTTHILEIIHGRLVLTKEENRNNSTVTAQAAPAANMGGEQGGNEGGNINGLTVVQQQVQLKIASAMSEHGISVQTICEQLRGLSETQIRKAIEFLSSEGHIYSTIDDDHYKTTDS